MDIDINEKINLISRQAEEVLTPEDLKNLLSKNAPLKHYIGFEISGKIHLGTGLVCMRKVKDFADAGVKTHIFLADYHTWINDKLGGNLEKIKETAVGYFKEGLSIAYQCLGGNPKDLNFILGSDFYHNNDLYWQTLIDVSKNTSLARMKRSITIMGRQEIEAEEVALRQVQGNPEQSRGIDFAKLLYPAMQVADIFTGGFHFSHAGIDQRKANVIARDVANQIKFSPLKINNEIVKPIAVHHHLLLGLEKPPAGAKNAKDAQTSMNPPHKEIMWGMKMSKSKPDSAVFIHDSEDEIRRKIKKAYCPEGEIEFNPIIDWAEYLIFPREEKIIISRKPEHGGNLEIKNINELKEIFSAKGGPPPKADAPREQASGGKNKELHPEDLKKFVAEYLIELLKPAREHFSKEEPKKMLEELEELIKSG